MDDHQKKPGRSLGLPIEEPISLTIREGGRLEIHCYQGGCDSVDAVPMVVSFSPGAGAQLVRLLQHALDSGQIKREAVEKPPFRQ
jgi:hypothetical protein